MRVRNFSEDNGFLKNIKYRSILVFLVITFFFVVFAYKAFRVQVLRDDSRISQLQDRQSVSKVKLKPKRGEILDSRLNELALSIEMDSIFIRPHEVKEKNRLIDYLTKVFKKPRNEVYKRVVTSKPFQWIKRYVDPSIAEDLKAKKFDGVYFVKENKRFYPNKNLAAQAIGVVGYEAKGLEGLELNYDSYLKGEKNFFKFDVDARGRPIFSKINSQDETKLLFTNYVSKENLVLTIDKDIQYWAEIELEKAVKNAETKYGEAIVLDPNTGKILAMANYPFFNPNDISKLDQSIIKNRTVTDMFEPGSIFKLFTVAAAFDMNLATPKTKFYCENGYYKIGNRTIKEAKLKQFEYLTVEEIIKYSSNIGSAKILSKIKTKSFFDYLTAFGFGEKTGIDLPGETKGRLRPYSDWKEIDKANIAFGQGVSVSSIQLAAATAALVNGGIYYKPYIVDRIVDNESKTIKQYKPEPLRQVIKKDTVQKVRQVMKAVIEPKGTGEGAHIEGLNIGGKTGTAQIFNQEAGEYYEDRYVSSFVGVFPIEKPKYLVLIKIDDPKKNKFASMSALPAFKSLALYLGNSLKETSKNIIVKAKVESKILVKNTSLIEKESQNNKVKISKDIIEIPDLKDMTLREALSLLKKLNLKYSISGSGKIVAQNPSPGSMVPKKDKILIELK